MKYFLSLVNFILNEKERALEGVEGGGGEKTMK